MVFFVPPNEVPGAFETIADIIGERAADASGVPKEIEPSSAKPALSVIEPELHEEILRLANRAIGTISALAETLIVKKRLSAEECYQILLNRWKIRNA